MIALAKPMLGIEEKTLVNEVLSSGRLAQGEYVEMFERDFALFQGSKHCIATSSGTSALHVALLSLGIKPGDKVITTPFSFIGTSNAILYAQAVPVFCDINLKDYNISPQELLDTIKKHPDAKAIIIVHLYGYPARMAELMVIANQYNLAVIPDQPLYQQGETLGSFTNARIASERVVSIPVHPGLTEQEVDYIVSTIQ
ncbi:MAG: aminotransferase class I/II-fold pyridoxal phosphate-dependent enzyme [Clostridiaceae bacterium]